MGGYFGFMLVVMFQRLLHHLFVELVKHVASVIAREGAFSIEFSVGFHRKTLSVGFWEGKRFVCMPMLNCGKMFHPQRVILIWFRDCLVPFLVMQQLSVVAGQMPIL